MRMSNFCMLAVLLAAVSTVQGNLITNGDFDAGGSSWSHTGGGGSYFYSTGDGDTIASIGWWNGYSVWQNTNQAFEADSSYTLSVRARTGDGALEGVTLSIIDVTDSWNHLVDQDFWFPAEDQGQSPGAWRDYSFEFDTAAQPDLVGHSIGVGVACADTEAWNKYGWLHIDQVTLVPEPISFVMLGLGALGAALRRQRR